jgi:antirestriction protein ArdC
MQPNTINALYEQVTAQIIQQLEQGKIPWVKPWIQGIPPTNLISKSPYHGINHLLLSLTSFDSPYFLTYKQAKELGGYVRAGEKAFRVIYWKLNRIKVPDPETSMETEKVIPLLRDFWVFNVTQCNNIPADKIPALIKPDCFNPIESADAITKAMPNPPKLEHSGNPRAYYAPLHDQVHMPDQSLFKSTEGYYDTLFHELVHSTGHEKRLDRDSLNGTKNDGSFLYDKEELIAELGGAFLCATAGITKEIKNNAAYIQGWLSAFKDDSRMLIHAAAKASQAANYVLDVQ